MITMTINENDELKKEHFRLTEEEEMLWDYCDEELNRHIFPLADSGGGFCGDGYLIVYGNTCEYGSGVEVYFSLEYFFDDKKEIYLEEARKYADSKKKEYTIEYVSFAIQKIRAKNDEEATKIANENLKRLNHDSEYLKTLDWDCPVFHYMVDENDKYVIYN